MKNVYDNKQNTKENKNNTLTLKEASDILNVSPDYLKEAINFRVVEGYKENGEYFIDFDKLERYINLSKAAKMLSVSTRTARRYEKEGLLDSYRFKNDLCFKLSDLEEFEKKSKNN